MTYSLQRTNPRISTNIKLVVDDSSNMYLETINSTVMLERSRYKAFEYNVDLPWGTNVKNFANEFADKDRLYDIVSEAPFNVSDRTELQFHQLYDYGAYSDPTKLVEGNYRFFAPLHVDPTADSQPEAFVIIKLPRVDVEVENSFNTLSNYIDQSEVVKVFELGGVSDIIDNIEQSSMNMQFENGTITAGLSLESGLMVSKTESIIDAMLANESTITEFENSITNNYREHQLVYSNVINLEFAFKDEPKDEFVRYVGMYVNFNELSAIDATRYTNTGAIRIFRHEEGYSKYENSQVLGKYDAIRHSTFANGFGLEKSPQIRLQISLKPIAGSQLIVKFDDSIEHTITFDSSTSTNINQVALFVANELQTNYTGQFSSLTTFVENGNEVVLRSSSKSLTAERLSVVAPLTINVVQPLFNDDDIHTYNNTFTGSGSNTISLNEFVDPTTFNKIRYTNNDGAEITSAVTRVVEYGGDFLYFLENTLDNVAQEPNTIWFVETVDDQPIVCSVLQHRDYDFDTTTSQYSDILDFDIDKYKTYLLETINEPSFRGRVDAYFDEFHPGVPASSAELEEYKALLIGYVNKYFDSIDLNRNYLFKNIDIHTEEATTIVNEYDRLNENSLPQLNSSNQLYKFINKWSYIAGTDVYANDYRLNISLPFRYDSFTPSLQTVNRDIRYHTHSWLIIGEGRNPYLDVNEENIRKCLSYSSLPLTNELLHSTEVDAYDYLQYETSVRKYDAFSNLVWDAHQAACYTYFRGVLLRFDDETLNDYRFAAILFSQDTVQNETVKLNWVRNDVHKTLTLVVNFYIPDPILTTLERGTDFYFLDRSLLYFSEAIYSTGLDSIDFGTAEISLTLYDNTTTKTYLGSPIENQNEWFYEDTPGEIILYVSRGDSNRFDTDFSQILTLGEDFTIDFTETVDISDPRYGMQITFIDIQEIAPAHFWCRDIVIKHILTHDPDGIDDLDPDDNIVDSYEEVFPYAERLADPDFLWNNNICYISRAIAYENANYERVVTASGNNARYKELSMSNISSLLMNTDIELTNELDVTSYLRAGVINPAEAAIAISLYEQNTKKLKRLSNTYLFPIVRHDGAYQPQTNVLLEFDSDDTFDRIFAKDLTSTSRDKLTISRRSTDVDRTKKYKETYMRDVLSPDFFEYSIDSVLNDDVSVKQLPWISNPTEFRSYVSVVLNTSTTLTYSIVHSKETDLSKILFNHVKSFCPISDFDLTPEIKENTLALKYDSSAATVPNYDIDKEIVSSFTKNTFMRVYSLESITIVADSKPVNFIVDDSILTILDKIEYGTTLELTFNR